MPARSKIEGLGKLDAVLKAKAALLRAATVATVTLETQSVKSDARNEAPRDTGELADGIESRVNGTRGEVEATARHSGFQEFGTSHTPAQPFMTPAAAKSKGRFTTRMAGAARRAVS